MITITITIGEIEAPGKTRGMLLCTTKQTNPTKEEHIIESMVFQHIKQIGHELSELRGATVNMIEGEGGKKKGGKDARSITSYRRGNPGGLQ